MRGGGGDTIPGVASEVHEAVRARDVGALEMALRGGADPNALDERGQPALRHVLTYGIGFVVEDETRAMIEALLDAGADPELAGVTDALLADAESMVTSGGEANDARALGVLLRAPRLVRGPRLGAHRAVVSCAAFSPDGPRLVSCDVGGTLLVSEPAGGALREVARSRLAPASPYAPARAFAMRFSPCGRFLVTAEAHEVVLRDASTLAVLGRAPGFHLGGPVGFADEGRVLAFGGEAITLFDVPALRARGAVEIPGGLDGHRVTSLAADPRGARLLGSDWGGEREDGVGRVTERGAPKLALVDVESGLVRALDVGGGPHVVAFDDASGLFLAARTEGRELVSLSREGDVARRFAAPRGRVAALAAAGGVVVVVTRAATRGEARPAYAAALDVATGRELGVARLPTTPEWIALRPDGRAMIVPEGHDAGVFPLRWLGVRGGAGASGA